MWTGHRYRDFKTPAQYLDRMRVVRARATRNTDADAGHLRCIAHVFLMANTYSQIYIQVVFAVAARQGLIRPTFKEELHKYVTGIVSERGQKLIAVNCMPDHTHLLIGLKPSIALSDLVRDVKNGSSNLINSKKWVTGRFSWQEGFGAFSYGHSQLATVVRYIQEQEMHHKRLSFSEEYREFLEKFEIVHDERFVFRDVK